MNHCQLWTANTHRKVILSSLTQNACHCDEYWFYYRQLDPYNINLITYECRLKTVRNFGLLGNHKDLKIRPTEVNDCTESHQTLMPNGSLWNDFVHKTHLPANCFFNKSEDCGSDINYNCEIYPDDTKQMIFPQKMAGWVLGRLWNIWVVACFRYNVATTKT